MLAGSRLSFVLPSSASSQIHLGLGSLIVVQGLQSCLWISGTRLLALEPVPTPFPLVCGAAFPQAFTWLKLNGAQLGLVTGHSGLLPSTAFTLSPPVHWDCVPFVSSLTRENKHNPQTRLVSVDNCGAASVEGLGVYSGKGASESNGYGWLGCVWAQLIKRLLWDYPFSALSQVARGVSKG